MPLRLLSFTVVWFALAPGVDAQTAGAGRPGRRAVLPRPVEMALARSAAPGSVTAGARILVLADSGFSVAEQGTTGVTCLVNRSWPDALEPECFDAEASATILPMEIFRTESFHRGIPADRVEREISDGIVAGRFRLPGRPAVVYMMSAGQRLIGDDGKPAGAWKPHLMIHYPFLTNEAVGHGAEPDATGGQVVDSGRPTANLMVIVPEFVPVGGGPAQ